MVEYGQFAGSCGRDSSGLTMIKAKTLCFVKCSYKEPLNIRHDSLTSYIS